VSERTERAGELTDVHGLSGAYVLDAVTDIERAAFDRHLRGCDTCALEVAELTETAARLADESWTAPPPRMRERVLAEVRQTRQLPPGRQTRQLPALAIGRPARPERTVVSLWRRRTALAVAAAVLAAGAGAGAVVVQESRVRDERAVADAARAQAARMESVLSAPDATLRGTAGPGGGRVTVVSSASRDAAVAVLADLPALGPDRVYQLWLIDGTVATSPGVLAVGATEDQRLIEGIRDADRFGVSVEPPDGSPAPSANNVLLEL
jgi:anti-sigma factor RsiW